MKNKKLQTSEQSLKSESKKKGFIHSFVRNPKGMFGLILFVIVLLAVFLVPIFMKLDTSTVYYVSNKAPSADHILGLDQSFQDCWSKLIIGGRTSLLIGLGTSVITLILGIPLGLIAGFYQGKVGGIINRIAELFISFPTMVLLLLMVAIFEQVNSIIVILVMGIVSWPGTEKLLYSTVLSVMNDEYIEAARAMGKSNFKIIFQDVLPNSVTPILVSLPFRVSGSIMMETSLAFLGLGVKNSWGRQIYLAMNMNIMMRQLWMWMPAAICLVLVIVSINCLGEGIRDSFDPKMARR